MDIPSYEQNPVPQPVPAKGLFASHPYAVTLSATAVLVLVGALFVVTHAAVPAQTQQTVSWGGESGLPADPSYQTNVAATANVSPQPTPAPQQDTSVVNLPIIQSQDGQDASQVAASSLDALLALLSTSSTTSVSAGSSENAQVADAYALIPQGMVATSSASNAKRTALQNALYNYGNAAGAIIGTYEDTHANVPQILKDESVDRTNADKVAAMVAVGNALTQVGKGMAEVADVPSPIVTYNAALAKSYEDIGAKLVLVAQAQSDTDVLATVKAYDSAADTFTTNYVALASYLSATGVTFAPDDPGSVFSFTPVNF
jgi:hypothetical protein